MHAWGNDKEHEHSYWQAVSDHTGELWWSDRLELRLRRYVKYWARHYLGTEPTKLNPSSVLTTAKNAGLFASLMAFTDWTTSLRLISARFFDFAVVRDGGRTVNINAINNLQMIQQFCTSHPLPEPLFWSYGQELNGVVLLRHVILSQNLPAIDGIIIRFKLGRIMFHGEKCTEIAASTDLKDSTYTGFRTKNPRMHPYAPERAINLSCTSRMAGTIVYVGVQALQKNTSDDEPRSEENLLDIRSEIVAESISNLLVTQPCEHKYYTPLEPRLKQPWKWTEGLVFSTMPSSKATQPGNDEDKDDAVRRDSLGEAILPSMEPCLYYQAVNGDGAHQWLACHISSKRDMVFVWQRGACLTCTVEWVNELISTNQNLKHQDICIISGDSLKDDENNEENDVNRNKRRQ